MMMVVEQILVNAVTKLGESLGEMQRSAHSIEHELKRLNAHQLIRIYDSWWSLLLFNLAKGIVFGLGTVLGATLVVSLVVFILSQLEIFPVIGDWIHEIVEIIESHQASRYGYDQQQ